MTCILIADDHPAVRASLRRALSQQKPDWQISEAENGHDAICKADEIQPDLIVLDLSMPVMNGLEAARELKRILPGVPLLLWTSSASPAVEKIAHDAGFTAVTPKADGGVLLIRKIHELLTGNAA